MEEKEKADKRPPVNFDELNVRLALATIEIDQQRADILALADRVSRLERSSGLLE